MSPSASAPALRMPSITIALDGNELTRKWSSRLREVCVQRGVRSVGRATLDIPLDNLDELKDAPFQLHQAITLRSSGATVFEGTIASLEVRNDSRTGTIIHVVAHDAAARLLRSSAVATMENSTYSDVVTKLLTAAGLRSSSIDLPHADLQYVMTGNSALAALDEIAVHTGRDWIVRDGKLGMWSAASGTGAPASAVTLRELSTFSVSQDAAALGSVTVRGWDTQNKQKAESTAKAAPSRGATAFTAEQDAETSRSIAHMNVADSEEAKLVATALVGTAARVLARGRRSLDPEIEPGGELRLSGADRLDGNYYVREVEHRWSSAGGTTTFVAGDRDAPTLTEPSPPPHDTSHGQRGLFVGVVNEVGSGPRHGQVRVTLPTLPGATGQPHPSSYTDVKSGWARVMMSGAGNDRGIVWLPEVDDEVVVAFTDGDVRRPVVLGSLHNGKDKVPDLGEGAVDNGVVVGRWLRSRLGHTLEFGDGTSQADQYVSLGLDGGEERLRIGRDRGDLTLPDNVPFSITVGQSSIDFDGQGGITINGTTVTIKAQEKLALSAKELNVTADLAAEINAKSSLKMKAGTANLEASGPLILKGAVVKIN